VPHKQPDDQKKMAALALMDMVQVVGVILQLMMVGPDIERIGGWYRSAWERVRAFFRHGRKSDAGLVYVAMQDADTALFLGIRDEVVQLEEGLPRSRNDLQATADMEGLYRTRGYHGAGGFMLKQPEDFHLRYRQMIVRRNRS
jgi:hypothetical protein